ncbi:MAG: hypothetical protein ACE5MI_08750 [Acidimicrobiia bacterium]
MTDTLTGRQGLARVRLALGYMTSVVRICRVLLGPSPLKMPTGQCCNGAQQPRASALATTTGGSRPTVFVKYYTHLERPFSELAAAFTPQALALGEWATDAYRDGERLTVKIGVGGLESPLIAKTVELHIEDGYAGTDRAVLSLSWTATGPTALFPRMDADLMIEPLGPHATQLTFQGSYVPPLGPAGRLLDRWVLHRVAEASVKNLVDRVAMALRGHESVRSEEAYS